MAKPTLAVDAARIRRKGPATIEVAVLRPDWKPDMADLPLLHHSLANLGRIAALFRAADTPARAMPQLAELLVRHGHPLAGEALDRWEALLAANPDHPKTALSRNRLEHYRAGHAEIARFFRFDAIEPAVMERFYNPEGPMFLRRDGSRNLLVLFGTMHNDFCTSFAITASLLRQIDCSLLFLKDNFSHHFFIGINGFASSFPDIAVQISAMAQREGIPNVFVTGCGSGGRAAMLTALALNRPYIGFSQQTAVPDGPEEVARLEHLIETLKVIRREDQIDLRTALGNADPDVARILFYGERDEQDAEQARRLEGMSTVKVFGLPGAGHDAVLSMIAADALIPAFARVMAPPIETGDISFAGL